MFIRLRKRESGHTQIQIVENVRKGATVKQKIVRNVATAKTDKEIEQFSAIAESAIVDLQNERNPVLPFLDPREVHLPKSKKSPRSSVEDVVSVKNIRHEASFNDGWRAVFGAVYDEMGMSGVLQTPKKSDDWNALLRDLVIARLADPSSKRQSQRIMKAKLQEDHSLDRIYALLDHMDKNESRIKSRVLSATKSIFPEPIDILFFDVTTLYFESVSKDDLKSFGFSKDCKFNQVQVVLALITTTKGLPVSFKLFPGNTSECKTLISCIRELKHDFSINQVILAADRAMFTEENLCALESEKVRYVVAAKLKSLKREKQAEILDSANYGVISRGGASIWAGEFLLGTRRLVVTLDRGRAEKDQADRQRLIERLLKKSKDGKPPISSLISNHGTKRYIKIVGGSATLNQEKIEQDEKWDGLHGIITNDNNAPISELLNAYHGLWQIEESFRVSKHDIKMRPIFHWTPRRIKAHILLCFVAFAVAKQTLIRLERKNVNLSLAELSYQLETIQQHRIYDNTTQKRYLIPSALSRIHEQILKTLNIHRSVEPSEA